MKVNLQIQRYNPEKDKEPYFADYSVEAEPTDRILDALLQVKGLLDGSLTLRKSCAHGVCGSDGMRINGRNALACRELVRNHKQPIVVEPMKGFKIIKDLVVDMETFFAKYRQIKPYLINNDPPTAGKERLQSQKEQERFEDTTKCILCACCTTACPSSWADPDFVGPAALVQAHRFIFDSRDQARDERLEIVGTKEGAWRCRTIFNCTDACPRGIEVTKAIGEIKREELMRKL